MKKYVALLLAMIMCLSSVTALADGAAKPQKITILVNGTFPTEANGVQAAWVEKWEELVGVELEVIQTDHDAYYDVLQQQIASGDWPDVMILSSSYYSAYASEGVLWDMTDAWENSALKSSGRYKSEAVVDGLKIDGRLYAFPDGFGGGCVTYIKKAWLDNVGMEAPTTWEEYAAVCDAFAHGDPDGNGVNGDTYAVTAAGFVGVEDPYINYLPEFYQDAYPSFYKDADGVWHDGFAEPAMEGALARLSEGYAKGWIDPTTLTNGTKDCRSKFYDNTTGIFTYWSGTWATNLKVNLEANNVDSELIPLLPLKGEDGEPLYAYLDRSPAVWGITTQCENPQGVFDAFMETMMDGADVQFLWTYGVEGVHWSTAAETVLDKTYEEGQFHFLEIKDTPGTTYTKVHTDPVGTISKMAEGNYDPVDQIVQPENLAAQAVFSQNSTSAQLVPSTEEMSTYNGDLTTLKNELIAKVAMGEMTYEEAMAKYVADHGQQWSDLIVASLNAR